MNQIYRSIKKTVAQRALSLILQLEQIILIAVLDIFSVSGVNESCSYRNYLFVMQLCDSED